MNKRKLQRNVDNEAQLMRHGKAVRAALNIVNNALKTAYQPAETLAGLEDQGAWRDFIQPGDNAGNIYEFDSFQDFVTHENGLNLDPAVYKWLMACPIGKIDFKAVGKRQPMNSFS